MIAPLLALHSLLAASGPLVLAIGVNQGDGVQTQALRYADDDAAEATQLFDPAGQRSWLLTVFDAESQRRYPELAKRSLPPSLEELRRAVREIKARIAQASDRGERPQVLVWMSGHAVRRESGQTLFPLQTGGLDQAGLLQELIIPLEAAHRVHLVLDSCFAASLLRARAVVEQIGQAEAEAGFFAGGLAEHPKVGVLVGAGAGTVGYEWSEVHSGVFSAMVRAGLRGAADVDGDERVDYLELAAFLAAASEQVGVEAARPKVQIWPPQIEQRAALSERGWLEPVTVLEQDLAGLGTLHVLDSRGHWLMGGAFEVGYRPRLWLPAGRSLYLRAQGEDRPLRQRAGRLEFGTPVATGVQTRALVDRSLRDGLFRSAFGPAYFRGFMAGLGQNLDQENKSAPGQQQPNRPSVGRVLSAGGAGLAVLGAGLCAGLAGEAAWRFNQTSLERPAQEAFSQMLGWGLCSAALFAASAGLWAYAPED